MIRRRAHLALVALAAVGALAGSACSGDTASGASPQSCKTPKAFKGEAKLPDDFPLSEKLQLTHFKEQRGFLSARGLESRTVDDVFTELREKVPRLGFDVIGTDYEGFEAEIFFARGQESQGVVSIREGPCRGLVTVSALYDPVDTQEGRDVLDKTRKRIKRFGSD